MCTLENVFQAASIYFFSSHIPHASMRPCVRPRNPTHQICNHPDLLERVAAQGMPDYGNPAR